jgi:predicted DNA-binding transcriptional regulator YafY
VIDRWPFVPPERDQPLLALNASVDQHLARLLDALLILDAEGSARVADLARRVGLPVERLRDLLSAYMVAGAEAAGPNAPYTVVFGTAEGPLDATEEYDEAQAIADHVFVDAARDLRVSLVEDVGRTPMTVDQVAAGLLAARQLIESDAFEECHRAALEGLAKKLSKAMQASVSAVTGPLEDVLARAVERRRRVCLAYRDPWTTEESRPIVEPYELYRQRDRLVLDAGPEPGEGYRTYEVAGIVTAEELPGDHAFEVPDLPPRALRHGPTRVVLRVPARSPALRRLLDGWFGEAVAETPSTTDIAIYVDRPAASRVGVLLLQLGPGCRVVSPAELRDAAVPVAPRLLGCSRRLRRARKEARRGRWARLRCSWVVGAAGLGRRPRADVLVFRHPPLLATASRRRRPERSPARRLGFKPRRKSPSRARRGCRSSSSPLRGIPARPAVRAAARSDPDWSRMRPARRGRRWTAPAVAALPGRGCRVPGTAPPPRPRSPAPAESPAAWRQRRSWVSGLAGES